MRAIYDFCALLGRLSLAAVFLGALADKLSDWEGKVRYIENSTVMEDIASVGSFWLPGAVALLALGGASLVLGFWTRLGTLLLVVFLCTATYFFHDFWNLDPETDEFIEERLAFAKNLAIFGGLLTVLAHGPGRFALDARGGGDGDD